MKGRFTSFALAPALLGVAMLVPPSLNAQENVITAVDVYNSTLDVGVQNVKSQELKPFNSYGFELVADKTMKDVAVSEQKAPAKKTAVSVNSLTGTWVMTYSSLLSTRGDGGNSITISAVEDSENQITINNFYGTGVSLTATVDAASGTISIPSQEVYTHATYGPIIFAFCTSTGVPDTTQNVIGTYNANGTITVSSWWGLFIKEGTNANGIIYAGYNLEFERPTATMTCNMYDGSVVSYGVVAKQAAENVMTVKNFGNYGMTLEIGLNRARGGSIAAQTVVNYPQNSADYITYAVTGYSETSPYAPTAYTNPIVLNEASADDSRTLSWGMWTGLSRGTSSYFLGAYLDGKISTNFDIVYPTLTVTDFEGEGTEENPYLLKTRDDLILLSEKVNEDTNYDYTYSSVQYASAYRGKYFRMENDIDMSGYRFTPIGADVKHMFGGVFDGNGKTMTNLAVNTGTSGYAGLFGRLDETSVVKNLTLDAPNVQTSSYFCGGLAGWSLGEIDNVKVVNPYIYSTGIAVGGVAGIGYSITNSSVEKGKIYGYSGFTGGVAGEIDHYIENCHATEMTIQASCSAKGYTVGGIVGTLVLSNAKNLYFSGLVDAYSTKTITYTGGLVGSISGATLENSFFTGTVTTYDTESIVGGVVGQFIGSTLLNCYSHGRVLSNYSYSTGGLIGYTSSTTNNGTFYPVTIKNCYAANFIQAETYQYNTSTGTIETIGKVADGTEPIVENVYFDNQLYNLRSEHYGNVNTEYLTSAAGPDGFDANVWNITEGQYPRIKGIDTNEAALLSASVIKMDNSNCLTKINTNVELKPLGNTAYYFYNNGSLSKQGTYATIEGNTIKIGEDFGSEILFVVNGNVNYYYSLNISPIPFEGTGVEADPYLIKTKSDLITLSEVTTNKNQLFPDTYFKIVNDIDMEYDTAFLGICADESSAHNTFSGHIDGDGHTIHNMKFNCVTWSVAPEDSEDGLGTPDTSGTRSTKGFIGRLASDGSVKNLNIAADCDFKYVWATTGALVGYNYGLVENCRNYADVTGYSCWIGGIVGQNVAGGIIRDCYNAGNISSGNMQAGGIAGANNGFVENCANTGDVTVKKLSNFSKQYNVAGGIVGGSNGGYYKNIINYGGVYATDAKAGGLTGSLDKVTASASYSGANDLLGAMNLGTVRCSDKTTTGAIGGSSGTQGEIIAYWDSQIIPIKAHGNTDLAGATGLETSALISGQALEGLDTQYWQFDEGMYPTLKLFADEPKVQDARKLLVYIPTEVTTEDLSADATLAALDGMTWALADGTLFSIDGNTLKVPATVNKRETDTLTGVYGLFTKAIEVNRLPVIPLQGKGTEENPYLISSATDWNALADYITTIGDDFDEKFLKVTTDFSFEDTEFKPLWVNNVNQLMGTFDGDGHTISGINYTTTANYQAPMGVLGADGTIKNLTLEGAVNSAYTYAGGFTSKVYGTLKNDVNKVNVTVTKGSGTSGFGYLYKGASLEDVVNKADMSSVSTYVAGVAAYAEAGVSFVRVGNEGKISTSYGVTTAALSYVAGVVAVSYPCTFVDCYNSGTFEFADNAKVGGVAGIVSYINSSATTEERVSMTGCYNTADITAGWAVSGLVASINATSTISNPIVMTGCYNTGNISSVVTATKSSCTASGLLGLYSPGTTLTDCYNTGNISAAKTVYTGGLVASYKLSPTVAAPMVIKNCWNSGTITANGNQGGGIIASISNNTTLENCYNTGNVEGGFGLGGIVGCLSGAGSVVKGCWNSGNITTNNNRVGGIIGYNAAKCAVSDCFNVGVITCAGTATTNATTGNPTEGYGAGGIAGQGSAVFTRCYNLGEVKGNCRVGGLIGYPTKNNTQLVNCYNAGTITAPVDTCGSLIGINLENGALWTESNAITNSYYIEQVEALVNDGVCGTKVTSKELMQLTAEALGEGWNVVDDYTYPILSDNSADIAKVYAVQVVPYESETNPNVITHNFNVGVPDDLVWTANIPNITFHGNKAAWSEEAYNGEFTITATCGDYSKSWTLIASKGSGVDGTELYGKSVVSETYFTTTGLRVAKPTEKDGNIYVVVRVYDDGSRETVRILN